MAGYSRLYVIGGLGGFMGADGVEPIEFQVLVGDGDRQWLEPHYFDRSIMPIGKVRVIVPPRPDHPDSCWMPASPSAPGHFRSCSSLAEVEAALREADRLDFDARPHAIPPACANLREEARAPFAAMNIWRADLMPFERT